MNLFEFLRDRNRRDKLSRQRLLPSQPEGTTPDRVYAGSDIGEIAFTGERPEAGDFTVIVGQAPRAVALSPQTPGLSAPLFGNSCRCKCGSGLGTIVWSCPIHSGPYLLLIDSGGTIRQAISSANIFRIAGVALDPNPPNNLYVLDDRTRLTNWVPINSMVSQTPGISTYVLHTFQLAGGSYVWSSLVEMADPGLPVEPFYINDLQWVTFGPTSALTDPPATYPTNCMSVIEGQVYIPMSMRPARYQVWDGSSFTTHSLSLNGQPYNKGLRGTILTGIGKPGRPTTRYALAWDGYGGRSDIANPTFYPLGYEVVAFDTNDNVIQRFANTEELLSPTALMLICNRVFVLQATSYGRIETGTGEGVNGEEINNSFGTVIPHSLALLDLCKSAQLNRINKQYQVGVSVQPTGVAALDCQPASSGPQAGGTGHDPVLYRFQQQTGALDTTVLTAADGTDRSQAGPAAQLATAPGFVMTPTISNPLPASDTGVQLDYYLGSLHYWSENVSGPQLLPPWSNQRTPRGFGTLSGPLNNLRLPPNRTFAGHTPTTFRRLADHVYDNYLLMPQVSFATEPLMLYYLPGTNQYQWFGGEEPPHIGENEIYRSAGVVTNTVAGKFYNVFLWVKECVPALLPGSASITASGADLGDPVLNGPALNREYGYLSFESGFVVPPFGGSATRTYTVPSGSLRANAILYSAATADPASFTFSINGNAGTGPAAISLPSGQLLNGIAIPNDVTQASTYPMPADFTTIDIAITFPGGFSASIQYSDFSYPVGYTPNNSLVYYEMVLQVAVN